MINSFKKIAIVSLLFYLFIGFLIVESIIAQDTTQKLSRKRYVDQKGNFKIVPPEGWRVQKNTQTTKCKVAFLVPKSDVNLKIFVNTVNFSTIEELISYYKNIEKRLGLNTNIKRIIFIGRSAIERTFQLRGKKYYCIDFLKGKVDNILVYSAPANKYNKYHSVVMKSIDTYEIILQDVSDDIKPKFQIPEKNTRIMWQGLQAVGKNLQTYRSLCYVGQLLSMVSFAGIRIGKTEERYSWGSVTSDKINVAPFAMGLSIGGSTLSLISKHRVGVAGEQLVRNSTILSPPESYLMKGVGEDLKKYWTRMYLRTALICGGIWLSSLGEESDMVGLLYMLGGIVSAVSAVSAPHFVGSAGGGLEELSTSESLLPFQKQLIKGAGRDLRTFRSCTYGGWVLGLVGGVITIVGLVKDDERINIGGVSTFALGYIMSNWIAPWSIGSAGKKLEEAGNPAETLLHVIKPEKKMTEFPAR